MSDTVDTASSNPETTFTKPGHAPLCPLTSPESPHLSSRRPRDDKSPAVCMLASMALSDCRDITSCDQDIEWGSAITSGDPGAWASPSFVASGSDGLWERPSFPERRRCRSSPSMQRGGHSDRTKDLVLGHARLSTIHGIGSSLV